MKPTDEEIIAESKRRNILPTHEETFCNGAKWVRDNFYNNINERLFVACVKQKALMDEAGLIDEELNEAIKQATL